MAATDRRHIDASPWRDRVELVIGNALDTLKRIEGPFDLVFILWHGTVVDPDAEGDEVAALRAFAERVHADDRVDNALLTVGDGLLVI